MINNGAVTFSFDCEGKWGMTDISTPWDVNLTRANLFDVYQFILETLKQNDIPATFAFVGAFTETREVFLNNKRKWCIVKLSPTINREEIKNYYNLGFKQFHCCNTIPVKEGGLSGKSLIPYTLGHIKYIYVKIYLRILLL